MSFSLPEIVAVLTSPELPRDTRREILALLACTSPATDALMVFYVVAGTTDRPRIGESHVATEVQAPSGSRSRRRSPRRWRVPPAMLREPDEAFDGIPILQENEDDVGLLLWQSFRDVSLWARTPAQHRGELFAQAALLRRLELRSRLDVDPGLGVWLSVLSAVLQYPEHAAAECIGVACIEISRRAARQRRLRTSLSFAQAAVSALPESAAAALEVGLAALGAQKHATAEVWMRRTLALGRRNGDWRTYAEALLDLGTLASLRGEPLRARSLYVKAYRVGRRKSFVDVRAGAAFGLFRTSMEFGPLHKAEGYAREAIRLLGRKKPESAPVYLDLAALLIEESRTDDASDLLRSVLGRRNTPADSRALALALTARISAVQGDESAFIRFYSDALAELEAVDDAATLGRTALELVRAALAVPDRGRARRVEALCTMSGGECDSRYRDRIAELLRAGNA